MPPVRGRCLESVRPGEFWRATDPRGNHLDVIPGADLGLGFSVSAKPFSLSILLSGLLSLRVYTVKLAYKVQVRSAQEPCLTAEFHGG